MNVVISRRCFAEDCTDLFIRACRTCSIFFHTRPIKFLIYVVDIAVPVVDAKSPGKRVVARGQTGKHLCLQLSNENQSLWNYFCKVRIVARAVRVAGAARELRNILHFKVMSNCAMKSLHYSFHISVPVLSPLSKSGGRNEDIQNEYHMRHVQITDV